MKLCFAALAIALTTAKAISSDYDEVKYIRGVAHSLLDRSAIRIKSGESCQAVSGWEEVPNAIACPAMRFLAKYGVENDKFDDELCVDDATGETKFYVEANKIKDLIGSELLQFDLWSVVSKSVKDRVFAGAVDGQTTGNFVQGSNCLNVDDNNDAVVGKCQDTWSKMWKLGAGFVGGSYETCSKIEHVSTGQCLNSNSDNSVIVGACGPDSQWAFGSGASGEKTIQKFKSNLCIQGGGVGSLVFLAECGGDAQVWSPSGVIDLLELQDNFDHAASTGMIGAATANPYDDDSFNQDKYDEFVAQLQNGDATKTEFTAEDVGRAVNHFGSQADIETTKVGPFSWAILSFEWMNTFSTFKVGDTMPLSNIEALFLNGGTVSVAKESISEMTTIRKTACEMRINFTSVKDNMDDAVAFCGRHLPVSSDWADASHEESTCCAGSSTCVNWCLACNLKSLFEDIYGVGYERGLGYSGSCDDIELAKEEGEILLAEE